MSQADKPEIVYILPEYNPDTGSHFFHLYELIERMSPVSPPAGRGRAGAGLAEVLLVIEKAKGRPVGLGTPFYLQRFYFPPFRFIELAAVLICLRFRGYHNFYTHYSFYGAMSSWIVAWLFGGAAYYWNCGEPWRYVRPRLNEVVFRFILRHSVLVTGTAGMAELYRRHYGLRQERIRILSNWVNVERFRLASSREEARQRLGLPADQKIALFVHRLSRRKGAHLIPEIVDAVTKRRKGVIFVIVGDGPEAESLKLKVQSLKLEPHVRLVGEVPNRELPAYYRAADVFLMPSEEEGFPHVLLEAMAAGLPYVASDVGGVRDITPLPLQSFIVASGRGEDFASNLIKLIDLPSAGAEALRREMEERMRKFDLESALQRFAALFLGNGSRI